MDKNFIHTIPLLLFTSLAIISVGMMFGAVYLLYYGLNESNVLFLYVVSFISICAGLIISLLHLGKKMRVMRSILGLPHSWLSFEVVFAGIFAASVGLALLSLYFRQSSLFIEGFAISGLISGMLLMFTIGMVYNLTIRKTWKGIINILAPLSAALLLGSFALVFKGKTYSPRWEFYLIWGFDFLLFAGRYILYNINPMEKRPYIFTDLIEKTRYAFNVRFMLSIVFLYIILKSLPFFIVNWFIALLIPIALIILDRFCLYASTLEFSPKTEIATLKEERMRDCIPGD